MYCSTVKEQFDVRIMIKAPIFSRQGFNMFQAHSALEGTYPLRVLAMLSFSVIIFYAAIEIGLYSLCRKKLIAAFKLNLKKSLGPVLASKKKTMICLSQAKPFRKSHHFVMLCICTPSRARTTDAKILRRRDAQCNTEE